MWLLWLMISAPAFSTGELPKNPPVQYRGELGQYMRVQRDTAIKLKGGFLYKLSQGERHLDTGFFGGDLELLFQRSPDAVKSVHAFQAMRLGGAVLTVAGSVLTVLSFSGYFLGLSPLDFAAYMAFTYGMLGAGIMTISAGIGMLTIAPVFLSRAVGEYNDRLYALAVGGAF